MAAKKIMFVGDSLTNGQNLPGLGGFRVQLWLQLQAAGANVDFVGSQTSGPTSMLSDRAHEGHDGENLDYFTDNIADWIAAQNPDIICLFPGMAHIANGEVATISEYADLMAAITAASPTVKVICCTIPPIGTGAYSAFAPDIDTLNALIESLVDGEQFILCHCGQAYNTPDSYTDDGVHPTVAGYQLIANKIYETLLPLVGPLHCTPLPRGSASARSTRNR